MTYRGKNYVYGLKWNIILYNKQYYIIYNKEYLFWYYLVNTSIILATR